MRKLIALCAISLVTSAAATYAAVHHAQLVQSTPADGSARDTAPASFVLEFSEAVRFQQAFLKKDGEETKPLRDVLSSDAKTITISAPPLAAGHYTFEWSAFTRGLTALSGHIGFTVGSVPPH
jgi:methionine-rich copper-binding protein CopC